MGSRNLTAKVTLAFVGFDLVLAPFANAAYLQILGVGSSGAIVAAICLAVILKVLACTLYIRSQLRDYESFSAVRGVHRTPELIVRADDRLQRAVSRVGVFYALTWGLSVGFIFLALQSRFVTGVILNSGSWMVAGLVMLGVGLGGFAAGTPLVAMLTASAAGECSIAARQAGIVLPREPESLQTRIGVISLGLALGPMVCSLALGYAKEVEKQEYVNSVQAELLVARLSDRVGATLDVADRRRIIDEVRGSAKDVQLTLVDRRGRSLVPDQSGEHTTPPFGAQVAEHSKLAPAHVIRNFGKSERIAYRQIGANAIAVAYVDSPTSSSGYTTTAIVLVLAIGVWAFFCALVLGRAITGPVERITSTTERIVEEGKQSEIAALPVVRNDEIGRLSERFNDLLEMMTDLSSAADSIATGKLHVEVTRKGELPDAFRRMLESFRDMVGQIRGTSVELASAATEILAASQEQESAAASQSSAMEEISRTMESLSASAAHVSDSVQGVLANAEQTLSTTDRMVTRISELSAHANRIGEILDVIRDVADRSDLLALNGSLEASRAGESGHGFALVAAEMRRLAERVTASVEDVKRLVSDIRDSSSSTVAATEEGRRLADGTTEAARQITFVTQQQRSGTEQVSESIRNITEVVTQAVSATAQTRTSAQGLKTQADGLAGLVTRFELEPSNAS